MSEPIFQPEYWKGRLAEAVDKEQIHHAIFQCPGDMWRAIAAKHREVLANTLKAESSVLDVGCGWGRLLSIMPPWWKGRYVGIDLSPDFIEFAKRSHPTRDFWVGDLRDSYWPNLATFEKKFDWAILISVRPMVINNAGTATWEEMEKTIRKLAHQILYLEYRVDDEGQVE